MYQGKSILAITLARGGSKSIPRKNIAPLNGFPLIAYTVIEAKRSRWIDDYIVSTDDEAIATCARGYGADVPFLRPEHLSHDSATSADAVIHGVEWVTANTGKKHDIVVELMCTNPMKTAKDIDAVIEKLVDTDSDSVIGVIQVFDHHPIRMKKIVDDRLVDFCLEEKPENRRQDLKPPAYLRNGAIYAVKREVLFETRARYGTAESRPYIMSADRSVNIDSPIDLMIAERLLKEESRDYSEFINCQVRGSYCSKPRSMVGGQMPKLLVITPIKHLQGVYDRLATFADLTYRPEISSETLIDIAGEFDAIYTNPNKSNVYLGENTLAGATNLKVIATASTGTNHIDLEYAEKRGVSVLSLTEERTVINRISSTAEHAFALLMAAIRHIPQAFDSVKQGEWDYEPYIGRQIDQLTIGVVGYGRLGSLFARYATAFGATVLVYDPHKEVESPNAQQVSRDELLARADAITFHVHVTDETFRMVNREWFNKMKDDVTLVNTSRGDIINEGDLLSFLKGAKNARYATDVLSDETRSKAVSPIVAEAKRSGQIIVTPHLGGMTREGQQIAFMHMADMLARYFRMV